MGFFAALIITISTRNKLMHVDLQNYDACIICFNSPENDARALNIAGTLKKFGLEICIVAPVDSRKQPLTEILNIPILPVRIKSRGRMLLRWKEFGLNAGKITKDIYPGLIWAADLYSLPAAIDIKKRSGGKVIYDSREIYSALGPLSGKGFKQTILSMIEKNLVKSVDAIVVSGELDAEYLKVKLTNEVPYHVIMNLPPYMEKTGSNILREKFNIPENKKIILYQGMLLNGRGIIPVIRMLKYTSEHVLCLLGSGESEDDLKYEASKEGVADKVIFCGKVPYSELHEYTCSADIGWCFIEPISFSYELALPNKLFEYIMARLPMIASNLPAIKHINSIYNIAELVESEISPDALAETLKIFDNKQYILNKEMNCEKAAKELNYEAQENGIIEFLKAL